MDEGTGKQALDNFWIETIEILRYITDCVYQNHPIEMLREQSETKASLLTNFEVSRTKEPSGYIKEALNSFLKFRDALNKLCKGSLTVTCQRKFLKCIFESMFDFITEAYSRNSPCLRESLSQMKVDLEWLINQLNEAIGKEERTRVADHISKFLQLISIKDNKAAIKAIFNSKEWTYNTCGWLLRNHQALRYEDTSSLLQQFQVKYYVSV